MVKLSLFLKPTSYKSDYQSVLKMWLFLKSGRKENVTVPILWQPVFSSTNPHEMVEGPVAQAV
jgi:hypothetical protein